MGKGYKIQGFKDTIRWYDANAEDYAKRLEEVPSIDLVNKFAERVGENAVVLDAGCAAGRDSKLLRDRGLLPTGIDISQSLIDLAQRTYPDIHFVKANFLSLPFQEESFDAVWAHASLLHLETSEEVEKALKEFYRVLKNDGVIHVFVKQQQGEEKTSVVSDTLSKHDRFFRWFTKEELASFIKGAGFTVEDIQDQYEDPAGRDEVKWIVALAVK